jgi:hypothetical protein
MQKLVSGRQLFTVSPRYIVVSREPLPTLSHRMSCGSSQMPRRHVGLPSSEGLGVVDFWFTGISHPAYPAKNQGKPRSAFANQRGW